MKHGKGHFVWGDGSQYVGDFDTNNIEGFGEYFWMDGRVFKGEWKDN